MLTSVNLSVQSLCTLSYQAVHVRVSFMLVIVIVFCFSVNDRALVLVRAVFLVNVRVC